MVQLRPMTDEHYGRWLPEAIEAYAVDKVKAGHWAEQKASELAAEAFHALLPEGLKTPENYLYTAVEVSSGQPIGMIWFHRRQTNGWTEGFIYNIEIDSSHRGQGLGKATMTAVETEMRAKGIERIGLNVFGFNTPARRLYESLGYLTTSLNMGKDLG